MNNLKQIHDFHERQFNALLGFMGFPEKDLDEEEPDELDGLCGRRSNHNNGSTEGCAECASIKLGI